MVPSRPAGRLATAAIADGHDPGGLRRRRTATTAATVARRRAARKAPATIPELTDDPLTLSFIWFEWPPAQALEDFANAEYTKERPNVTIEVNTVPNANWHDAMFTQFAARKTDFDIAILDSQHIGEAVTNGNILDITDFVNENIDVDAYDPYLLAAYGQYPQAETGQRDENASLYGLPLLGDTWTMIYRKDLIGDEPPADLGRDDLGRRRSARRTTPASAGWPSTSPTAPTPRPSPTTRSTASTAATSGTAKERKIEGVINDEAGQKAMDVLVNEMKPLTAKGSGNWFIDEVNAAVAQGKACIAFQWIAASGGLLDPEQSTLGKTREEILDKLGFATLPTPGDRPRAARRHGDARLGLRLRRSSQAEALNFMKWFEQADIQKKWAAAGGVPSRTDALESPGVPRGRHRSTRCTPTRSRGCGTCGTCPSTPGSSTSRTPT